MRPATREHLLNTLFISGLSATVYGAWLYSRPLAFVVGGVACMFIAGMLVEVRKK